MTGLAADALCLKHDPGFGHPECPERYDAVIAGSGGGGAGGEDGADCGAGRDAWRS